MKLLSTLSGLVMALGLTAALAQSGSGGSAPTQQQIDAAKKAAAGATGAATTQTYTVDADGKPVIGADGKPVLQQKSATSMRDSLTHFQGMTGVSGMEQTGSPANRDKTGGAKVTIDTYGDFSCGTVVTPQFSAGPLTFRVVRCDLNSQQQGTVTLRLCDAALKGGACTSANPQVGTPEQREAARAEDERTFQPPFQVQADTTSVMGEVSLGLGCNSKNNCRLSVKGTYAYGGNDQTLKQGADAAIGEQRGLIGDFTQASTTYAGEVRAQGQAMRDCRAAQTEGEIRSCDPGTRDTNVARIDTPQNNGQCQGSSGQCIKKALQSYTFTKSCTRSFFMTERVTNSVIDASATATCNLVKKKDVNGVITTSNSCTPEQLAGATLIGETDKTQCAATRPIGTSGATECVEWRWTEYQVKLGARRIESQTANPPVTGACDTSPLSETRSLTCNGSWFGRTLPASACTGYYYDESTGATNGTASADYQDKAGCGVCLSESVSEMCYGSPQAGDLPETDCAAIDLSGCRLKTTVPRSQDGNLTTRQEETYECTRENEQCVQWAPSSGDSACLSSNMTFGTDQMKKGTNTADGSMNAAMVAAATVDATAKGIEGSASDKTPKLFTGIEQRCNRATGGFVGSILQSNCCRMDIERPTSSKLTKKGCSEDEARLSAARRSSYSHFVGEYCSKKLGWPFKSCIRKTETYCTFPGILPKIVHQQGRPQLEAMAAGGTAQSEQAPLTFSYYDSGDGRWSAPITVNGVKVTAWQWPKYCADPAKAAETLMSNPAANECSGYLSVWFAACDNGSCETLPNQPSEGSVGWSMRQANPLENITTGLNRYAVATGACSPGAASCQYTIAAWPVGKGGRAVVARDITWALYANYQQEAPVNAVGASAAPVEAYQMNNIGDLMFKGYSVSGMAQSTVPATVRLDFSRDGGATWSTHALPTDLRGKEMGLPNSEVKVTGYCDALTNLCGYRIVGTTVVTAKPWGDAQSPDCSGFTPGQLAAMDFGKMDLSEWLDSVMKNVSQPATKDQLTSVANAQFQEFNSLFSNGQGTVKTTRPTSANFARTVPYEGFGPFESKLSVGGFWPEVTGDPTQDVQKVTAVTVDWGDCTPAQALTPTTQGAGFGGSHVYDDPKKVYIRCGFPDNESSERNFMHKLTLTVNYTDKKGLAKTETVFLSVENAWAKMPGSTNNNVFIPVKDEKSGPVDNQSMPPPPK